MSGRSSEESSLDGSVQYLSEAPYWQEMGETAADAAATYCRLVDDRVRLTSWKLQKSMESEPPIELIETR
jgi:hypothetical protein